MARLEVPIVTVIVGEAARAGRSPSR